jgi:hypothetical protein
MTMNAGLETPQIESRGKVLKVPATPAATRRTWSGLRKYGLAGAAVALLVIAGGIAIGLWGIGPKGHAQYVTVPAARGSITRTITATGTVNPVLTIIVGSYVSGVIQSLSCDYNTEVKAGQVCAKIDPRPYQATLDQYSGQLARDQPRSTRIEKIWRVISNSPPRTRSPVSRPRIKAMSSTRTKVPSSSIKDLSRAPSSISVTPTSCHLSTAPSFPAM